MKNLINLTTEDINEHPLWECSNVDHIEVLRHSHKVEISEADNEVYVVATDFELNNGQKLQGICSPQDSSGLDYIQPIIVSSNGHFRTFKYDNWTKDEQINELRILGLNKDDVFPIKYRTRIRCDNEYLNGIVLDFNKDER